MARQHELVERSIRAIEDEIARLRAEIDAQQEDLETRLAPLRGQLEQLEDAWSRLTGAGEAPTGALGPADPTGDARPAERSGAARLSRRRHRRGGIGRATVTVLLPLVGAAALALGYIAVRDAPEKPGVSIGLIGGASRPQVLLDGGDAAPGEYLFEVRPSSGPRGAAFVGLPTGGAALFPLTAAPRNTPLRIVLSPQAESTRQRRLAFTLGRDEGPQGAGG